MNTASIRLTSAIGVSHTAAAIALLFENFTTVFVGESGLGFEMSDQDAIATLSGIWKNMVWCLNLQLKRWLSRHESRPSLILALV